MRRAFVRVPRRNNVFGACIMYGSVCVRLISALRYAVLISVELESLKGKCELSGARMAKKRPDSFPPAASRQNDCCCII